MRTTFGIILIQSEAVLSNISHRLCITSPDL